MRFVISLLIARLLLLLCVVYAVSPLVPYNKPFPYEDLVSSYGLPHEISSWAGFDGAHYIKIAKEGYHQYDQAFFPLYPTLIRHTAQLFQNNHLIAALLISNISFFIGVILFYNIILLLFKRKTALWATIFLLAYPTAFFFSAAYTESLMLLVITATVYCFLKKKTFWSLAFSPFSSLIRLQGVLVSILIAFFSVPGLSVNRIRSSLNMKNLIAVFFPFLGLLSYMIFLKITTGDALYFINAQPVFGASRSVGFILLPQVYYRYFKIFLTSDIHFQYFVALFECIVFTICLFICLYQTYLFWKERNAGKLGIALFSLSYILLPTLSGTFLSMPRFSLFAWSLFIFLGGLASNRIKTALLFLFIILQILCTALFTQSYFIS